MHPGVVIMPPDSTKPTLVGSDRDRWHRVEWISHNAPDRESFLTNQVE
jgi:hypothetical protein